MLALLVLLVEEYQAKHIIIKIHLIVAAGMAAAAAKLRAGQ
jgi:hypothetical protein